MASATYRGVILGAPADLIPDDVGGWTYSGILSAWDRPGLDRQVAAISGLADGRPGDLCDLAGRNWSGVVLGGLSFGLVQVARDRLYQCFTCTLSR